MAFHCAVFLILFVILASSQCQGCNQTLSQSSGTFTSPGFPQEYADVTFCSWTIGVNSNHIISLSFSEFELEPASNCRFDYVKVYDGSGSTYPLLGNYCGKTLPNTIISTGNRMYVVFKTDGSGTYKGFSAAYQSQGCIKGRYGTNCAQVCSQVCVDNECDTVTGNCVDGCKYGYSGDKCNECVDGKYGSSCTLSCASNCDSGKCHRDTGYCTRCVDGYYGNFCENRCNQNCKDRVCNQNNGLCSNGCIDGYFPSSCTNVCSSGRYGPGCSFQCSVNCKTRDCHHVNGTCTDGCKDGYTGTTCTITCPEGTYGPDCGLTCSPNCEGGECDHVNGYCTLGCTDEYVGDMCDIVCDSGTYGPDCQYNCSQNCKDGDCHPRTGQCDGCIDGYTGDACGDACQTGVYGPSCSKTCSINCFINVTDFLPCHHETGACPQGCVKGYTGQRCESEISDDSLDTLAMGIGIGAGGMVLVVIAIVVGVCCYRRHSSLATTRQEPRQYIERTVDGQRENSYKGMYRADNRYNLPTAAQSEDVYQNTNVEARRNIAQTANADANLYEDVSEMGPMDGADRNAGTITVSTERSGNGIYANVGMTE